MALRAADESLLQDWIEWSQQSSKFAPGECERKWSGFQGNGYSVGTIFHLAEQGGWEFPFHEIDLDAVIQQYYEVRRQRQHQQRGRGGGAKGVVRESIRGDGLESPTKGMSNRKSQW